MVTRNSQTGYTNSDKRHGRQQNARVALPASASLTNRGPASERNLSGTEVAQCTWTEQMAALREHWRDGYVCTDD